MHRACLPCPPTALGQGESGAAGEDPVADASSRQCGEAAAGPPRPQGTGAVAPQAIAETDVGWLLRTNRPAIAAAGLSGVLSR